eukprot:GDKI01000410.1.p1 GENE.GDKI01000410.1~~GDKI01000410.1.p1  ORF type:complete len:545 (-),score=124.11 GDKI01000410.1:145-1644(-)
MTPLKRSYEVCDPDGLPNQEIVPNVHGFNSLCVPVIVKNSKGEDEILYRKALVYAEKDWWLKPKREIPHSPSATVALREGEEPHPQLLLAYHGLGDSCANMCKNMQHLIFGTYSNSAVSNVNVLVCPCGMSDTVVPFMPPARGWKAGKCCTGHDSDMEFFDRLIPKVAELLVTNVPNNEQVFKKSYVRFSNIFAAGFSNGGMFSQRLACERPGVVDGVISMAGTNAMLGTVVDSCDYQAAVKAVADERRNYAYKVKPAHRHKIREGQRPFKGVSVLDIHSSDDGMVAYSPTSTFISLGGFQNLKTAWSSMAWWAEQNRCQARPVESHPAILPNHCHTTHTYTPCQGPAGPEQGFFAMCFGEGDKECNRPAASITTSPLVEIVECRGGHVQFDFQGNVRYMLHFIDRIGRQRDRDGSPMPGFGDDSELPQKIVACRKDVKEEDIVKMLSSGQQYCASKTGETTWVNAYFGRLSGMERMKKQRHEQAERRRKQRLPVLEEI